MANVCIFWTTGYVFGMKKVLEPANSWWYIQSTRCWLLLYKWIRFWGYRGRKSSEKCSPNYWTSRGMWRLTWLYLMFAWNFFVPTLPCDCSPRLLCTHIHFLISYFSLRNFCIFQFPLQNIITFDNVSPLLYFFRFLPLINWVSLLICRVVSLQPFMPVQRNKDSKLLR